MKSQIKIIYLLSTIPLIAGSLVFYYWYYQRIEYAESVYITELGGWSIVLYLFSSLIAIVWSVLFVIKNRAFWKQTLIPMLIIFFTFELIGIYSHIHYMMKEKAYIRIINDTHYQIERIWSINFENTSFEEDKNECVISFYPVYNYDWSYELPSGWGYKYEVNPVKIDLHLLNDTIQVFELPELKKGDCKTIRLSEIVL